MAKNCNNKKILSKTNGITNKTGLQLREVLY